MTHENTDQQKTNVQPSESVDSSATHQAKSSQKSAKAKPASTSADPNKPAPQRSKPARQRLVWLAIALSLGVTAALYWHVHQQAQQWQKQQQSLRDQVTQLQTQLGEQTTQNHSALEQVIANSQIRFTQQQQSIEALQRGIQEQQGRRPNDWLIAEAHYLVNLAGRKLWLEHDPRTAAQLLFSADARIAELNDPSLTLVRQDLADDIARLNAIDKIDRTGIVLQLTSLQKQVATLPLPDHVLAAESDTPLATPTSSIKDWKQNLAINLQRFGRDIISYQRIDQNQAPLLSPKQRFFLQENLKQQFAIASQAVLTQNQALYDSALETAQSWITDFFAAHTSEAKAMLAAIHQLRQLPIQADYPKQLQSQHAMDSLAQQRLGTSVAPNVETKQPVKPQPAAEPKPNDAAEPTAAQSTEARSV